MVPDERADAVKRWRVLVERGENSGRQTFVRPDGSEIEAHFPGRMTDIEGRRLAVFVVDTAVPRSTPAAGQPIADVTPREREVIRLIALGASTREIAAQLSISVETVRTHVRNAMRKLGVRTRAQLAATPTLAPREPAAALRRSPRRIAGHSRSRAPKGLQPRRPGARRAPGRDRRPRPRRTPLRRCEAAKRPPALSAVRSRLAAVVAAEARCCPFRAATRRRQPRSHHRRATDAEAPLADLLAALTKPPSSSPI